MKQAVTKLPPRSVAQPLTPLTFEFAVNLHFAFVAALRFRRALLYLPLLLNLLACHSQPSLSASALSIDLPSVSYAENEHHEPIVFDLANQPVVAHAVFPEVAQL